MLQSVTNAVKKTADDLPFVKNKGRLPGPCAYAVCLPKNGAFVPSHAYAHRTREHHRALLSSLID
jgi:hypothetical protein